MQLVVELLRNSQFLLAAKASQKARARKRGSLPKERAEMPTPSKGIHSIKNLSILWWICDVLRLWKGWTFGGTMPQWVTDFERKLIDVFTLQEAKDC
jgi:hypothetical protein